LPLSHYTEIAIFTLRVAVVHPLSKGTTSRGLTEQNGFGIAIEKRLKARMQQPAADLDQRDVVCAMALTGSLARGRVWEGSDLDFWGFWDKDDDVFEDGMTDGIYWEIDIQPLEWLRGWDEARLSQPPDFDREEFGVTPLEA